ncbi:C40 family peptidase [Bacillus sp. FJAT-29790]|nr:C40 family peptidase [Bacillus sp. FJAT-29790]MBU8878044.1 C40 family peptidase [Bacillus sp. FJAT-29790]
MLGLGSAFALPSVHAESFNKQKSEIQNQRLSVQSSLRKADQEMAAVLEELARINAQIKRVDQAIIDNNKMIVKTESDIVSTKAEIEQLQEEMSVIKERIEKRNLVLKQRALSFQENGNTIGYVEVLLGSTSFGDFIERVGAVTKIVEADQDILAQHDADKKSLEEKQASIENKLAGLTNMKMELEGMRAQMEEQKKQNDELKQELKVKEQETAVLKASLQNQDSLLASKELEIQRIQQAQNSIVKSTSRSSNERKSSNNNTKSSSNQVTNIKSSSNNQVTATANTVVASGNIGTVISAGYKYIGNSVYVFGGGRTASDIANGRFDCSGFVSWAYSQAGIKLPAYTESLKNSGRQVPTSDMQPGDLVFFDTYKKDGHVGIYIGGGKFIGSQSSTGVAIANMSSGYWKNTFNGRVVRI